MLAALAFEGQIPPLAEPVPMSCPYRAFLAEMKPYQGESTLEHRRAVDGWCRQLAARGWGRLGLPPEQGGDPEQLLQLVRALLEFDRSLFVKFGVHVGLIQGCLARLGSQRHQLWLERTWNFEQLGCFAMTESDHGSNVRGLETRATYFPELQQFEIHTPHPGARKDYIGGALSAAFAIVFAQLESHGVHAFLVPLRDEQGQLLEGIEAQDCGRKLGLNGVDNGRLSFHRVRVPRENLLNRYGEVLADGSYTSPIAHPTKRFFTMVSNLVDGRLSLSAASHDLSQRALNTALGYARQRRQFGPPGQPEVRLIEYQSHQVRLLPRLAITHALHHGVARFVELYRQQSAELETFAAGLKAYSTWELQETLRLCRDCCGGWGYLWESGLPSLKADGDIFTTFEGDNTVLSFLVARNRLKELRGCRQLLRSLPWPARLRGPIDDPAVLLRALQHREQRLGFSLARRLARRLRSGLDPLTALADCQLHALAFSRAYVERALLESCPPDHPLTRLYGLEVLRVDRGWFLEQSYMSRAQSRQLRRRYLESCRQLALQEFFTTPH